MRQSILQATTKQFRQVLCGKVIDYNCVSTRLIFIYLHTLVFDFGDRCFEDSFSYGKFIQKETKSSELIGTSLFIVFLNAAVYTFVFA